MFHAGGRLKLKPYLGQTELWPKRGRVILAQYDDETIVVYQAYRKSIARAAVADGKLGGGGFRFDRMSWIKTNFMWMMYRSGWAAKADQEHVLAIWIDRSGFDRILADAVHAKFVPELYPSQAAWQAMLKSSEVRLQWDPDRTPRGDKLERRAIQLGLGAGTLRRFASEWIRHIEDITPLVKEQAQSIEEPEFLFSPAEKAYPVTDREVAIRLLID
ncbi:MAG: DUF4291 domain-containing protein [Chloroflexi bacterium]|nr:DUF4291 domain-containing protein [Chloroflexota bacterium]